MSSNLSQFLRFKPDPLDYAQLDLTSTDGKFRPEMLALINNESFTGAGLVTMSPLDDKHKLVTVMIGRLGPIKAEVMWQKEIEKGVYRLGLKFLD